MNPWSVLWSCIFISLLGMWIAYSGVVSNIGQYPMGKGDAYSFLSTGPLCRYAADLLPMFKLFALDEHRVKLRLDEQVSSLDVLLF